MKTTTLESIIKEHPFFQDLPPPHLDVIVGCAKNVRFAEGATLFREGAPADQFYLLREGLVSLDVHAPGRAGTSIQTISTGDVLGWSWLFPPYRWQFSARAMQPVRAIAFDGKCLRKKCEADHDLGYELMKRVVRIMMQRLQATRLQLLDVYGANACNPVRPSGA
jgi:CRP-like cAMP-binding protein